MSSLSATDLSVFLSSNFSEELEYTLEQATQWHKEQANPTFTLSEVLAFSENWFYDTMNELLEEV